jgi:hypothetical protein
MTTTANQKFECEWPLMCVCGAPPSQAKAQEAADKVSRHHRNPFDVERSNLLQQLSQMRANFML